jgi:hypothetical protein
MPGIARRRTTGLTVDRGGRTTELTVAMGYPATGIAVSPGFSRSRLSALVHG